MSMIYIPDMDNKQQKNYFVAHLNNINGHIKAGKNKKLFKFRC